MTLKLVVNNRQMFSELIDRYTEADRDYFTAHQAGNNKAKKAADESRQRLKLELLDGAFPLEPELPHVPKYYTFAETAQWFQTIGFTSTREVAALLNVVYGPEAHHLRKIIETVNEPNIVDLFMRTPNVGRTTTRLVLRKLMDKGYSSGASTTSC